MYTNWVLIIEGTLYSVIVGRFTTKFAAIEKWATLAESGMDYGMYNIHQTLATG